MMPGGLLNPVFAAQTCSPSSWMGTGSLHSEHSTVGRSWDTSPPAGLGGVFVLKIFKWKSLTSALQTAHCMSFSPAIFSALNEALFSLYPRTGRGAHLVRQAEQMGWAQGSKIARVFVRNPQIEQPETSGLVTWRGMGSSTPNVGSLRRPIIATNKSVSHQ